MIMFPGLYFPLKTQQCSDYYNSGASQTTQKRSLSVSSRARPSGRHLMLFTWKPAAGTSAHSEPSRVHSYTRLKYISILSSRGETRRISYPFPVHTANFVSVGDHSRCFTGAIWMDSVHLHGLFQHTWINTATISMFIASQIHTVVGMLSITCHQTCCSIYTYHCERPGNVHRNSTAVTLHQAAPALFQPHQTTRIYLGVRLIKDWLQWGHSNGTFDLLVWN